VTVPSNKIGKNGVDVKIAVDAIDMTVLKNADIRTVVLVSGDGDFTPLVNYLKEHGKYVVGMGIRGSTADFLATACHVFLYLEKDERAPDPIETHPLIRQGPPAAATEPARAPEAATARFEVERRQDGATSEALVERYLTALRGRGVEISPNEHRPLILREAHALFKNSGWRTFLQGRDELKELFKRKHPEVMVMHVLDAVYQIQQASCLEWELSFGQFPADTPLHQRKCRLHGSVQTADDLLRKVDAHLLSVVAAAVRPEAVDVPAAARILYGRKPNAELAAYIAGLLGHRSAASSAWPA